MSKNAYVGVNSIIYTPVEYIESSGTQYIDTGLSAVELANTCKIVERTQYSNSTTRQQYGYVYYVSSSSNSNVFFSPIAIYENNWFVQMDNSSYSLTSADTNIHTLITDALNGKAYIDDTSYNITATNTGTTEGNIFIFGRNNANMTLCSKKLYYMQFYNNNVLVRDFIPVLDRNNVACLYDRVENKLYYNKGTGTFTAGATTGQAVSGDVARTINNMYVGVATSYTPVEYIESTGTQYIDTGFKANNNTKVEYKCSFNYITTDEAETLFCCRDINASGSASNCFTIFKIASGTQLQNQYNTTTTNINFSFATNTIYTFIKDKNVLYANGSTLRTDAVSTFQTTHNLLLFICNTATDSYSLANYGKHKLYSCKIWDNGTLVRDFIPVKDQDNIGCLYESVENKLYYNNGGGHFNVGTTNGDSVNLGQKAKKIIKGYVGVNGIAKYFYNIYNYPTLKTTVTETAYATPTITRTKDYILIAGGQASSGATPVKTVRAYNNNLVLTQATDMTTQTASSGGAYFNGYGIIAGGQTASSASSRTGQVLAYNNNLEKTTLSTINQIVWVLACANETHCIIGGGSNYSNEQTTMWSYDTNFTKTTITSMSTPRRLYNIAKAGNYIVCCGGAVTKGATDFYDNSNVKTTTTEPYGKNNMSALGVSSPNYAVFFGGATNDSVANAYADTKAYNKNKVLTSFNAPFKLFRAQGFYKNGVISAFMYSKQLAYDDNLVLISNVLNYFTCNNSAAKVSEVGDSYGVVCRNASHQLHIFNV